MLDTKILNENVHEKKNHGYYQEETEHWLRQVMRGEGLWKMATEGRLHRKRPGEETNVLIGETGSRTEI